MAGWTLSSASVGLDAGLALGGLALVLAALVGVWDDGLAFGAVLLLAGYSVALADDGSGFDLAAPFVALALVGVVELGSWSLELSDGAEERPQARLPTLGLIAGGSLVVSAVPLVVASSGFDAGLALWMLGALAAIVLLGLIAQLRPAPE